MFPKKDWMWLNSLPGSNFMSPIPRLVFRPWWNVCSNCNLS
jgi:hypothetical protein